MSTLNINGDNNDPYYRYTMPLLISTKAGKGNGCFTIIDNLQSVTGSFNHPASIVFKLVENRFSTNSGMVYSPFSMKIGRKYLPTIINVKAAIHS